MNDVSPFNDWKEKSVLLNANEYSRVRWAFAPNGIAVHRHRSQRIGFVMCIVAFFIYSIQKYIEKQGVRSQKLLFIFRR
jgi:hypothetical protein